MSQPQIATLLSRHFPASITHFDNVCKSATEGQKRTITFEQAEYTATKNNLQLVGACDWDEDAVSYVSYFAVDSHGAPWILAFNHGPCSWDGLTRSQQLKTPLAYEMVYQWDNEAGEMLLDMEEFTTKVYNLLDLEVY